MDALQQAKDVSEEAVKTYDLLYGRNRRKRHLSEEVRKGTADRGLLSRALEVAHPQGRKLSPPRPHYSLSHHLHYILH